MTGTNDTTSVSGTRPRKTRWLSATPWRGTRRLLRSLLRRWGVPAGVLLLALIATLLLDGKLLFSPTPSLPRGLYLRTSAAGMADADMAGEHRPGRFAVVVVCLPERWGLMARNRSYVGTGKCPGGVGPLGKLVVAGPGDVVCVDSAGVWVEPPGGAGRGEAGIGGAGREGLALLIRSAPHSHDSQGRYMKVAYGCRRLGTRQYWLYSGYTSRSFDSRYFGPVRRRQIRGTVRLLWSWEAPYRVLEDPAHAFTGRRRKVLRHL